MIVIGTSGHIDHGKSSIVKRLTGTDPDRLPEEKKRGMTIDLGFAFYETHEKKTIALVDVPGHERFVKNMIAGAGGIDAVMLVVAADDGWMPQTEEHFQIVRLLGVKTGIITINKCDLATKEDLLKLRQEIKEHVSGSFLESVPILEISATTGQGFEELKASLDSLANKVTSGLDIGKARLYIDRVFVRPGIGAVATGTLRDGTLNVGETVTIWPSLKTARIKTLQSNNQTVSQAAPSQRTAVSLAGVDKTGLKRGGAITRIEDLDYLVKRPILALKIELLKNAPITIDNRRQAILLVGTSETLGEIRLLSGVKISRGQSGIIFFKPEKPVFILVGDRVILRLPSPMVTLGGGEVLDHLKTVPSQKELTKEDYLSKRDARFLKQMILSELQKETIIRESTLLSHSNQSKTEITAAIIELISESRCGRFNDYIYETTRFEECVSEISYVVSKLFSYKKGIGGLTLAEIVKSSSLKEEAVRVGASYLVKQEKLQIENDLYRPITSDASLAPAIQAARDMINLELKKSPLMPPSLENFAARGKDHKEAIKIMIKSGEIHKCGSDFVFLTSTWNEIESFIKYVLNRQDSLTVGELRDKFKITRKYAVPILEETDRIKLTRRQGDVRVKGEKFNA